MHNPIGVHLSAPTPTPEIETDLLGDEIPIQKRTNACPEAVTLNPERDCIIKTHSAGNDIQPLAA